ncbi:amino acid permease [Luteimonas huabeiensis]|uniref:amino acid permease n=1 Tax=Luteimonas huabeiensis TaxID=1244513 RepID=UPI000462F3F3|nr:amino acid permease [Luteimonas huabeiensis]
MFNNLLIKKPIQAQPHVDAGEPVEGSIRGEATFKRTLTAKHLVMLGLGAVIGAGIFVITGTAAANHAGPAIMLSFVIAGFACAMAGLCYAEFAAMIPASGSAYSYTYATLGEAVAWFVGWSLVLEYLFAASTVAVGWSGYTLSFLESIGIHIPAALSQAPINFCTHEAASAGTCEFGSFVLTGALFNLPAVLIIAAVATLCYVGITQSATANAIIVSVKVLVILLLLGFGAQYVNAENWLPFVPENQGGDRFGWEGVVRGASIVFFAYIGFDAVSTAAQEVKNPQRDMPIGILGSLLLCTVIYIAVSAVLTGIAPYTSLGTAKPVATALEAYPALSWLKSLVEIGAIAGLTTVILVMLMGQPRIFYSMAQDGLLPRFFGAIHPKFQTPHKGTVLVALIAAVMAALLPIQLLGDVVSMGTLVAFATVCIGVMVLRRTQPGLHRPFRVPAVYLVGTLGVLFCLGLVAIMPLLNWLVLLSWTVIGFIVYFAYGYRRSKLRHPR